MERKVQPIGKAQYHTEIRLPDGLIVDKEIAQIISYLKRRGVQTVECCINGWGSGYAYVIVETIPDLDLSADILGHIIDATARDAVEQCLATGVLAPEAQSLTVPSLCKQCDGPWWPSHGWFVGAVSEPGRMCPVIAWPTVCTADVEKHVSSVTGLPPVRLRRRTLNQWIIRR